MSKESSIGYAITQLNLREIKTTLNVWAVLELIWIDGYEQASKDCYEEFGRDDLATEVKEE